MRILLEVPDSTGIGLILGTVLTDPEMGSLVRLASVMYPISDIPVVASLGWTRNLPWRYADAFEGLKCCRNFSKLGRMLTKDWLHCI